MASTTENERHTRRPSVYLDQWVWIRLAAANAGRPREPGDPAVLEAVRAAKDAGVAFVLSATHYIETQRRRAFGDRADVAMTMAEISHLRTLRSRDRFLEHQILDAMHSLVGRPTFRPPRIEVLGVGTHWAFLGEQQQLTIKAPPEMLAAIRSNLPTDDLCRLQQWTEIQVLQGPRDDDIELLRNRYGYRPESTAGITQSRLDWETTYAGLLLNEPVQVDELRFRVGVREVLHEHFDLIAKLCSEYGLPLSRLFGDPLRPVVENRTRLTRFVEVVPSIQIAVDLKTELFRDTTLIWKVNHMHDIDALSFAIPYCHLVITDKQMHSLVHRSETAEKYGTKVIRRLDDLIAELPQLADEAQSLTDHRDGWDQVATSVGFDPLSPHDLFGIPEPD